MEYQYSRLVDPAEYKLDGLNGLLDDIPLREHTHSIQEDVGSIRAQEDWSRFVSPIKHYKGGLAPRFNFMSVTIPECLPDRLEIVSSMNEFAFLHDGMTTSSHAKFYQRF